MFSLNRTDVKLLHVNARAEKHGDDNVLSLDLKMEFKGENKFLDDFAPGLREALYWKKEDGQVGELFGGFRPNLRFPDVAPIKWTHEYAGYSLEIESGIDDDSHILLDGCEVNNFSFQCEEGGTVVITFRVQCHPDEEQAGHLLGQIQNVLTIKLTPPDPNAVQATPTTGGLDFGTHERYREDAITEAFLATEEQESE